jgi:alginate O-acetyltransferase complex protein AlgI
MTTLAIRPFALRPPAAMAVWVLPVLIAAVVACLNLEPWRAMVAISLSIYGCFKLLSWETAPGPERVGDRWLKWRYLLFWPGMDPAPFSAKHPDGTRPAAREWAAAIAKSAVGVVLVWNAAGRLPHANTLLLGWVVLIGLGLTLHCGLFHALALAWRMAGVPAEPIMNAPPRAHSVSDFWGRRWNLAFRDFAHRFVFRPCLARFGAIGASRMVFLFSGIIHELAISVPAGGGYGLPLLYFMIQSAAVEIERSRLGRRFGLKGGWRGRLLTAVVVVGPAGLLFHRQFLENVVLPFAAVISAL